MNALPVILQKRRTARTDIEHAIAAASEEHPATAMRGANEYGRLVAQIESMRLVLDFYANGNNWKGNGGCPVMIDRGEKARLMLSHLSEDE